MANSSNYKCSLDSFLVSNFRVLALVVLEVLVVFQFQRLAAAYIVEIGKLQELTSTRDANAPHLASERDALQFFPRARDLGLIKEGGEHERTKRNEAKVRTRPAAKATRSAL